MELGRQVYKIEDLNLYISLEREMDLGRQV